jgi:thiosulfate/3-mercaptopyruvate sulfurtransferase
MTSERALVRVHHLADMLRGPQPPTLLDVRWTLARDGREAYLAGHLPGAVFADLDTDLCGAPGAGGRHPLPEPDRLQSALRRLGVRADHPVVVYDAGGPNPTGAAARVWWTLRWAGHRSVAVLDGGYPAWVAAGLPSTTDQPAPQVGDVEVRPGGMPVWGPDEAATGRLIDARVEARYRGEVEPVDPIAGHIPGAVNLPATSTVDDAGTLCEPAVLRERFAALGIRPDEPVGAYCGSGVTAAQTVLALTEAGFQSALYVGSWSHWITDTHRPIATGA